jgi:hypothetical protein
MPNKKILILFFSFLVFFLVLMTGNHVNAQSVGIRISPTITDETVNPGDVLNRSIKVKNDSDAPKVFYVYLFDFKAGGETGIANLILPGSEPGPYLSSWLEITNQAIEFSAGEEKIIDFNINVPSNAGPGGYYGAVVFGTEPPKLNVGSEERGAAMSISQQTASLILIQVRGDVNESASIREFSTKKQFYSLPFNVEFLTRIEDTGNVHIKPRGQIKIINMFGKDVATISFNDKGSNILPKSIRRFEDVWAGKRGFGKYNASVILSFGTSADEGGQGKQTLYQEISFWILPWKIIIPVLLSLIFLIILISLLLKFYKNKAVKKAMKQIGAMQARYGGQRYNPAFKLHLTLIITIFILLVFLIGVIIYFIFFA